MKSPAPGKLRIATRKSALALWQAEHVASLLRQQHPGLQVELLPLVTEGDRILDKPLASIGGKGLFLKELERALLDGEAELAVHSMKDVPVEITPGLEVGIVLPRANPFDALLSRSGQNLAALPAGARVGSSSLRRQCQLLAARPDLQVSDLRGNVNTRIRKLQEGEYEAIILACAGLERLGFENLITQTLEAPDWLPAPTQGTIGVQYRTDDAYTRELLLPLDDAPTALRSRAERSVARSLQGSCQVPLAVYAELEVEVMHIQAMVGEPDGSRVLRSGCHGAAADIEALAGSLAEDLLQQGAAEIIARS
ncbi:MAG TPA: hydroxymethylbilane synthase [Xanthomonadales bacterium]|nr:hydroxymethylbilane synthase [Xanthomonadales bacterium]